jgi:ubiquinone/menaquinone biosynthesis C-methylase UbiE
MIGRQRLYGRYRPEHNTLRVIAVSSPGGYTSRMQPAHNVLDQWSGSAPFWEKHRDLICLMYAPVTQALIEATGITLGHTVLDVGTGTGEPALTVAGAVGPEGKVFGVDPVPAMVAAARRAADKLGVSNAQFELAPAERLEFPDNTFDAVVSRFGVMFFPSPVAGVREMLRVLKPGGKLVLAAWHFSESNPYHDTLTRIVERYTGTPSAAPDAPGPFRFASPGKLLEVVQQAGADSAAEYLLRFDIRAPISVEKFWNLRVDMGLRDKLSTLSAEQVAAIRTEALQALREYASPAGVSFPGQVLIVSGSKA